MKTPNEILRWCIIQEWWPKFIAIEQLVTLDTALAAVKKSDMTQKFKNFVLDKLSKV